MKKTIYIYILGEQAPLVLICLVGACFVMVAGQLFQLMRILFSSSCSIKDVAQIIFFAMPRLILYAAPMAALLGVMLAFARLNGDNELIALRSAGTGFVGFLPPVLVVLVFATALAFINAIYVLPLANSAFELKLNSLGRASIPALIKDGVFISAIPKLVFFFRSVDHSDLSIKGVFIQDLRHPNERVTIVAESAQIVVPAESHSIIFRLGNGVITRTAEDLQNAEAVSFKDYDFTLTMDGIAGAEKKTWKTKWEMNLSEVWNQVNAYRHDRREFVYWSLELHTRLALPSACLLLGLLGPPLGSLFRQRGRMTGITICVGAFLAYYVLLSACSGLVENSTVSPFFGVWTPNLLSLLLAVYLWIKLHRETPFRLVGLCRLVDLVSRARSGKTGGALPK